MEKIISIVACCLLLNSCSGQTGSVDSASLEIIENALTFELSFGDDNLPDEYLLAEAMGLAVNDVGDIYIFDEQSVKVYDRTGKEKEIMGGPGEGPGEFEYLGGPRPRITSNDGFLTVTDSKGSKIFDEDNKYVDIFTIKNNGIYDNLIQENDYYGPTDKKGLYLDTSKRIVEATGRVKGQGVDYPYYSLLFIEYDNRYFEIAKYNNINELQLIIASDTQNFVIPMKIIMPFRGALEWGHANSGEIVFSHPGYDIIQTGMSNLYTINVFDPSDLNTRKIEHSYKPILLADSVITNLDNSISSYSRFDAITKKETDEAISQFHDKLEDNIYYAPFQKLIIDGNITYVFTYEFKEANGFLTDIFDIGSMEYLRSAYFSVVPLTIKNGFAYRLSKSSDGFDIVEKYKIDPKVYGK